MPTTPRPRQNASTSTRPIPSERDGSTSTQAPSIAAATSADESSRSQRAPQSRTSDSATSVRVPLPTTCSDASGMRGAASRHAAARPSTFLYASRTPTKSATGFSGSGRRGATNGSRSMYAGKVARRLDAEPAHETRGERRDRAHGVGAAERRGRNRVADAPEQPVARASRRAGSTCASRRGPRRRHGPGRARRGGRGAPLRPRTASGRGPRAGGTRAAVAPSSTGERARTRRRRARAAAPAPRARTSRRSSASRVRPTRARERPAPPGARRTSQRRAAPAAAGSASGSRTARAAWSRRQA